MYSNLTTFNIENVYGNLVTFYPQDIYGVYDKYGIRHFCDSEATLKTLILRLLYEDVAKHR